MGEDKMFDFDRWAETGPKEEQYPTEFVPENIFVISIGGSVIIKEKPSSAVIAKIANSINELKKEGYKFAVTLGGGKIARDYTAIGRTLGANNFLLDEIAISLTRANAALFASAIDDAFPITQTKIHEAKKIIDSGKVPVYGGIFPGLTTDTIAALLAEFLNATFVNLSNQKGIYTADPKEDEFARFIPKMDHERLLKIMLRSDTRKPGQNTIIDLMACLILRRSKIKTIVCSALDMEDFENAIRGNEFEGTIIETREEE